MTAVVQDRYSCAPEDLFRVVQIDTPTVGDGDILVGVRAASVGRGTWHIMSGLPYPIRLAGFGLRRPKYANPGRNLAGTVEAVGSGVTGFAPGDEVFGTSTSTFAQYAIARCWVSHTSTVASGRRLSRRSCTGSRSRPSGRQAPTAQPSQSLLFRRLLPEGRGAGGGQAAWLADQAAGRGWRAPHQPL
ncbi:hypothetical protein AB0878_48495 [Amycolatopsis sp. NPDC047767]|uniref:alcohol dehydrogenase catalytic domain-containing protein n=1 Tax=Amycolatopsis sp. NPDC047767 TaxID=3156765 RepID=UPI003451FB15